MTSTYPFHKVIEEILTEALEGLIKKSIGELPLTFAKCQENKCTFYTIMDHQGPLALLHFNYEKLNGSISDLAFEERINKFLRILKELRSKENTQISGRIIGIGLWGLSTVNVFRKYRIGLRTVADHYVIDIFDWYGIKLNKDLTMDIDNYILYQKMPRDEKIELAKVFLEGLQDSIDSVVQRPSNSSLKD